MSERYKKYNVQKKKFLELEFKLDGLREERKKGKKLSEEELQMLAGYDTVVTKLDTMKELLEAFEYCEMPSADPETDDGESNLIGKSDLTDAQKVKDPELGKEKQPEKSKEKQDPIKLNASINYDLDKKKNRVCVKKLCVLITILATLINEGSQGGKKIRNTAVLTLRPFEVLFNYNFVRVYSIIHVKLLAIAYDPASETDDDPFKSQKSPTGNGDGQVRKILLLK
ncbi:hypothetical protein DAPPUDRAFT_330378 [Daphnia pulex]|uniref:Uncharacterized protein n=1 Tax=Daphnia pulex TaxID=6669 RepID=E9HJE2_DAPPU|nr:hypothetical protein DAPPUDRAFT_330378 [Daphnia pulex]|eukprot:EFX68158.1 hypothetical protein DAPPUDRAFT_330378 [Daphnia pulex]